MLDAQAAGERAAADVSAARSCSVADRQRPAGGERPWGIASHFRVRECGPFGKVEKHKHISSGTLTRACSWVSELTPGDSRTGPASSTFRPDVSHVQAPQRFDQRLVPVAFEILLSPSIQA